MWLVSSITITMLLPALNPALIFLAALTESKVINTYFLNKEKFPLCFLSTVSWQTDCHCHVTRSPHSQGSTALVLDDDEDDVGGYDNYNEDDKFKCKTNSQPIFHTYLVFLENQTFHVYNPGDSDDFKDSVTFDINICKRYSCFFDVWKGNLFNLKVKIQIGATSE